MSKTMEKFLEDAKFTTEQKKIIDKKRDKYFKNRKCDICGHNKFYSEEIVLKIEPFKKLPKRFGICLILLAVECEFCNRVYFFQIKDKEITIKNV